MNEEEMQAAVREEWDVIPQEWINSLIRSAAARCARTGSGKTIIPEEHQNLNLYLHINKLIKLLIIL